MSARAWIRVPGREKTRNNIYTAPEKRDLNFEFHQMEGASAHSDRWSLRREARKEIRSGEKRESGVCTWRNKQSCKLKRVTANLKSLQVRGREEDFIFVRLARKRMYIMRVCECFLC
jgi:hypothetical protein